jgi:hypothetical protein
MCHSNTFLCPRCNFLTTRSLKSRDTLQTTAPITAPPVTLAEGSQSYSPAGLIRPNLPYLARRSHFYRRSLQQLLSMGFVTIYLSRFCALVSRLNCRFTTEIRSEVLHGFKIKQVRTFIFLDIMRNSIV